MSGACNTDEMRNVCEVLVGKPGEKRALRRLKHRWENKIRMDLRGIGWEGVD
jgi:hypothetical protein